MADIFLSYVSADRQRARQLADRLAQHGYQVWWDRTIPPGRVFDEVIQEALHAARSVVVLWSAESVRSNWVKTEAAEGASLGRLVPVLIERVPPPIEFKRIQAADLTEWSGEEEHPEFEKLVAAIDRLLQYPPEAGSGPPPSISLEKPTDPTRGALRTIRAIAAMALLVAVAGGGYVLGKRTNPPVEGLDSGKTPASQAQPSASEPEIPPASARAPAVPVEKRGRMNLLSPENGGEIVTASTERWAATIDGKEDSSAWVDDGQAVFGFKDGRAATFDTFAVLIPGANDSNLAEFELLAGNDGPGGAFTRIGTFKPQNIRMMKQPYQEFRFPAVTAKFLKFRSVKSQSGSTGAVLAYEFQLLGTLD